MINGLGTGHGMAGLGMLFFTLLTVLTLFALIKFHGRSVVSQFEI